MTVRRRFLAMTLALFAPLAVQAQPAKSALIGFLGAESAAGYRPNVEALREGLRDMGYVEGKNVAIEFRWAEGKYARLPELAEQLVRLKVDVIVTHGAPGTGAAKRATMTIPIVMASAGDAVATGLVASLARPGGNITGSTFFALEIGGKRLDLLKEAIPRLSRVAWLFVADNPITPQVRAKIEADARSLNVALEQFAVREPNEFESVFSAIGKKHVDALLVPEYSLFRAHARTIAGLAAQHRLPTMGFIEIAEAGGMLGYGIDDRAMYRRAAVFVDRILKGAKPGDLPIERAATFQLLVNRKTVKNLGIALPSRSFLLLGPRGTGKTTWPRRHLPRAQWYNLLLDRELAGGRVLAAAR